MDKALAIIEQLQKELDVIFQRLDLNIPNLQTTIFENVMLFVAKLNTKNGNLIASVQNLKILRDFTNELSAIIGKSAEIDKVVIEFTKGLEVSTKYINEYFSTLTVGFASNQELYKVLKTQIIGDTVDLLKGVGMEANLLQPIKDILRQNITTGGSYKNLQKQLLQTVNSDKVKRYVGQITNDAIMGYERNYMITIAQDLKMNYYLYQGTEKNSTRPFCQSKVGKFFTADEVKNWADMSWEGKRIGTNQATIFYFVGGYNCRHRLLPVSKEIYDFNKK